MDRTSLRQLLQKVAEGSLDVEAALRSLSFLPFEDLGFAKVDHHRELRSGIAEAVFGEGKAPEQVAAIVGELIARTDGAVLVTRASAEQFRAVRDVVPSAVYHETPRLVVARSNPGGPIGKITVATGGTADLPVAEESALSAEAFGAKVERIYDVGVAGIHRLLAFEEALLTAEVVVVVAGMDGALASIVGGLVRCPVVAVPTSVGYGAGIGGIAPLLTMLNSCAPGVAVVNIDNGFGAAAVAAKILQRSVD